MSKDILGPDGVVNRFPDQMPDDQIEKAMASHYGAAKPDADPWTDAAHSVGTGLQQGVAQLAGMPRDLRNFSMGVGDRFGAFLGVPEKTRKELSAWEERIPGPMGTGWTPLDLIPNYDPSSAGFNRAFHMITGPEYQPQTRAGKYTKTIASFAPAMIAPGGLGTRIARAVIPGVASEAAGEATEGTPLEPWARAGAGLLGGVLTAPEYIAPQTQQSTRDAVRGATFGLLKRDQLGAPEAIRARGLELRQDGTDPLLAQYGESLTARASTLAGLPGQTKQIAKAVLDPRRADLRTRALNALDQAAGGTTRLQARNQLAARKIEEAPEWNSVLAKPVNQAAMSDVRAALARLTPEDTTAADKAMANFAIRRGINPDALTDAQRLHYLKRALNQRLMGMKREGLQADEARDLGDVKNALQAAMNKAIPGYERLNARWRGIEESSDAVDWGVDAVSGGKASLRPDELAAEFKTFSPLQQLHARIGMRNELNRLINVMPGENIGKVTLSPELAQKIQVVFGARAQSFLKSMERLRGDFADYSAMNPRKYAAANNIADAEDFLTHMPISGEGMMAKLFDQTRAATTQKLFEHGRNLQGKQLFATFTKDDEDALIREMLARQARRNAAAQAARLQGASSLNQRRAQDQ